MVEESTSGSTSNRPDSVGEGNLGDIRKDHDPVNAPAHYRSHPSGIEAITIIEHLPFNIGTAMKYLWRAGLKDQNPIIQDLRKSIWYIDREIQRLESNNEMKVPANAAA